jgi:hypothetical protein
LEGWSLIGSPFYTHDVVAPCSGVKTLTRGRPLNCTELAARLGASRPLEGVLTGRRRQSVCRLHASPSSTPRLQLSPKTFGVSIRTAFPRTRRGSVSPPPPHVPAPPGARAPPQPPPRADPAPPARAGGASHAGPGQGRCSTPRPAARVSPHTCRPPAPAPAPRPRPRPGAPRSRPPAARSNSARSAARPRCRLCRPEPRRPARHGPRPRARSPPPAAPRAPGAQLIPNWRGGARGAGGPSRFPVSASGGRVASASLTWTTPLPGHVHAKVGGEGGSGGGGGLGSAAGFLARRAFFTEAFIYLFLGSVLPHPRVPSRWAPQPVLWGPLLREEGQGTLTEPLSKATKVLLVPIPKPKAGWASAAEIYSTSQAKGGVGVGGRQAVCLSRRPSAAEALRPAGPELAPGPAGLIWECWRREGEWPRALSGGTSAGFNFPPSGWCGGPSLASTPGGGPGCAAWSQARVAAGTPGVDRNPQQRWRWLYNECL